VSGWQGRVTPAFIEERGSRAINSGYSVPRYLEFCAWAINQGFIVDLDEAVTTVSKYVFVREWDQGRSFKLRFSNHKPNRGKELEGDCDFFVGVTHTGARTTEHAMKAVLDWRASGQGKQKEDRGRFRQGHRPPSRRR
jgi:hypothetical protein